MIRDMIRFYSRTSFVLNQDYSPEQRLNNQSPLPTYEEGTQFMLVEHLGNDGDLLLRDSEGREFIVDGDVALELFQ